MANSANNGGKTGWPPRLLQDDHSGLSRWLASKPDAKQRVREFFTQGDIMDQYFDYLNELRDSGETNMFGAVPYLMEEFPELTRSKAKSVLFNWMESGRRTVET